MNRLLGKKKTDEPNPNPQPDEEAEIAKRKTVFTCLIASLLLNETDPRTELGPTGKYANCDHEIK